MVRRISGGSCKSGSGALANGADTGYGWWRTGLYAEQLSSYGVESRIGSDKRTRIESNKCLVVDDGIVWKVGILLDCKTHIGLVVAIGSRRQVQVVESPFKDIVSVNTKLVWMARASGSYS